MATHELHVLVDTKLARQKLAALGVLLVFIRRTDDPKLHALLLASNGEGAQERDNIFDRNNSADETDAHAALLFGSWNNFLVVTAEFVLGLVDTVGHNVGLRSLGAILELPLTIGLAESDNSRRLLVSNLGEHLEKVRPKLAQR